MFTSEQLDALQAAAEAATAGPWGADHNGDPNDFSEWFGATGLSAPTFLAGGTITATHLAEVFERPEDASFIAAANPAVVLELVAAHRAALSCIARVEALHPRIVGECHTCSDENGPKPWPCATVHALTEGAPDAQD